MAAEKEAMEFRKKRIRGFVEDRGAPRPRLFTTFAESRPEDYTSAEYIEFDTFFARDVVAPTLRDARTGTVVVQPDQWSEKRFRPSYIGLEEPIMLYDLMRRLPGESEEVENTADWEMRALPIADKILRKMHNMIGLQVDLQWAQVAQTGKVSLKDDKNNASFELDYGAKSTHFVTATSGSIVDNIAALCDTVVADGERPMAYLVMSSTAFKTLASDATFQKNVVRDGLGLGSLSPENRGLGETYYGWAMFGMHRLEIYVYNATYVPSVGAAAVPFLDPNKIVILPRKEDLDFRTVYGGVPSRGMQAPFSDAFPSSITYTDGGNSFIRVHNRVYWYEKGDGFVVEAKCRPLAIPVSLDRWGCLTLSS